MSTSRGSYAASRAQHRRGGVDRVDAEPGPGAVRPPAPGGDLRAQRALAAGLDLAGGRLEQDREVARPASPGGSRATRPRPFLRRLDLLVVVEDQGQRASAGAGQRGQPQQHRHAGLHVRGAAAVEPVAVHARRARCRRSARCRGGRRARTRRARPSSVRASTVSPSRTTSRPGTARSAASTASASAPRSPDTERDVDQGAGQRDRVASTSGVSGLAKGAPDRPMVNRPRRYDAASRATLAPLAGPYGTAVPSSLVG